MVMLAKDGHYYAIASQMNADTGFVNIQLARSRDLKKWEQLRDALPLKPEWAQQTQEFRSPHVVELDGVSLMYYSGKPDPNTVNSVRGGTCMNIAFAEGSPEGPYMDQGFPLHCMPGSVDMSPMAFDDPVTGKILLYWTSGGGFIVRELRPSRVQFDAASDSVDLVIPQPTPGPTPTASLLEGIWVHYRTPYYYLFYSRRECCSGSAESSIMVARSRSAIGPFEGRSGPSGSSEVTLLAPAAGRSGIGQVSIVRDSTGEDLVVYDVVDSGPASTANEALSPARTIRSDKLVYRDGWPYLDPAMISR
jgi:arabinan endo-1,5-alpha-L-arabinosidase